MLPRKVANHLHWFNRQHCVLFCTVIHVYFGDDLISVISVQAFFFTKLNLNLNFSSGLTEAAACSKLSGSSCATELFSIPKQSGRSVNLRTPCCHRKEWRPLAWSNAIGCYNSDLATKLRRRSDSLYIGYVARERVGRESTWSAVRIYVQKANAVCNFLLRSRCWEGPWASFHQKKILVHQRVLKKSGLSQTDSDETTPFSWSVRFCFWMPVAWRLGVQRQQRKDNWLPPEPIAGAVGGWRFVGDVLLSWLPLAGLPSTSSAWASFILASEIFVALVCVLTMVSGRLSYVTLAMTHK